MLCFHCPLVEGMMPEEQLSFPCDFHFSKHILMPEVMVRLFLLKKTIQVLNPNYEYSQKKISMSRTPQYFSRFPFRLSVKLQAAAAYHSLCQCICQLVWRKSPSTKSREYDQTGNYSLLCNFILVYDWLHIKGPLSGSHWYLLR